MRTGDIVLIPFPFSELTSVKVRPSLVVSVTKDKYRDLVLAAISSQIPDVLSSNDILIQPHSTNGLRLICFKGR